MADIETLTDLERKAALGDERCSCQACALRLKMVRIIDGQASALDRIRKVIESEPRPVDSPEARLAREVQEALGG